MVITYFPHSQKEVQLLSTVDNFTVPLHTYLYRKLVKYRGRIIDYRCDNRRFWLSTHNCRQVSTPTSQNLELEQQIRIFRAD